MLAYVDCFSGVSGDMLLGALVDAGVAIEDLRAGLATLPVGGYELVAEPISDHGLRGMRVHVVVDTTQLGPPRDLAAIEAIITAGTLPRRTQDSATAIFRRLAAAEAQVHGVPVQQVHFHEVGAVDAIVDVVGIALGFERLGVAQLYCSALPFTSGRVASAHGDLPVPAPATVELLRGTQAELRPHPAEVELVTPTGAAVVTTLARFERPALRIRAVGHGFGQRQLPWANCLRLLVGEAPAWTGQQSAEFEEDTITVIEANLDDMSGEALGWLMDRLFEAGALDVSLSPLHMKKNRPGTRLSVLANPESSSNLAAQILRESTTLGVRLSEMRRLKAHRQVEQIATPLGQARVKLKMIGGDVVDVSAEFDDARALASAHGMPLRAVMMTIEAAARTYFGLADASSSRTASGEARDGDI